MDEHRPLEHVVDIAGGSAVDRDFEGPRTRTWGLDELQSAARQYERDQALARLRQAACQSESLADLLIVMGLDE